MSQLVALVEISARNPQELDFPRADSSPSVESAAVVDRSTEGCPGSGNPHRFRQETGDDGHDQVQAEDRSDWRSGLTLISSFAGIRGGDLITDYLDTFSLPRVAVSGQMCCLICGSLVCQFHVFLP